MKEDNQYRNSETVNTGFGYRHQQCCIMFFGITTAYSIRSCMGVALVAMTDTQSYKNMINVTESTRNFSAAIAEDEGSGILNALMLVKPYPYFIWSKKVQDMILSSFFWGYMSLQLPAGMLVHRFGTRYLLFGAMLINSILFFILPWVAYYGGWIGTMLCRILQGFSQACIFPCTHTFFGKWSPLRERSRMTGLVYGGQALGTVLGLPLSGLIASSGMGWPGIFRFYGLLSGLFAVIVWFFFAETPAKHQKISQSERRYIENELGDNKKPFTVPWSRILRNKGVWACVMGHVGYSAAQLFLFSEIPSYMAKVMGVNIKANGFLTALPFLAMWISNFAFCVISDWLINRKIMSVTNTRKFMNSIGSIIPCFCVIAICFVPNNIYIVETLLVITCAAKIATHMGFQIIHIDMAPNFAGTLYSLSNFVANGVASFVPVIVSFTVNDVKSSSEWSKAFYLVAGLYFVTNLVFVLFASAERVEWNDPTEEKKDDNMQEMLPMLAKINQQ